MKYGLQVYTLRNAILENFFSAFDTIRNIGYKYVELCGLFEKKPVDINKYLDQIDLTIASVMFSREELENQVDEIIQVCKIFACSYVVCPYITEEYRTLDGYEHLAKTLELAATELQDSGITLAYHNHSFEFDKFVDGRCGYDILFDNTEKLCFEPDVYWFEYAGINPLNMMKNISGRMPLLHLKDMDSSDEKNFCEVGHGILPIQEILTLSEELDVQFIFVEQDSDWAISPVDSATTSLNQIMSIK